MRLSQQVRDFFDQHNSILVVLMLTLPVTAAVLALVGAVGVDQSKWRAYATQHHCVAVAKQAAHEVTTEDERTTWEPLRTVYVCDNGEEQIR